MVELFAAVVIAVVLGGVAGVVAAFTHQALLTKFVATVKADASAEVSVLHDKVESIKSRLEKL